MKSTRAGTPLLLAACGLVLCCQAAPDFPPGLHALRDALPVERGLGVIVISFDALRADALGLYGYSKNTSPNLDAFARRSLVFDRAYTSAPVTPTSFASAFSGLLAPRVFHAWNFVAEDTLAGRFRAAGYTTAGIVNTVQLTPERGFDRDFEHYVWVRNNPDDVFLDQATAWLFDHQDDQRLFAWIHFLTPHAPYVRMPEAEHLYAPGYEGPFTDSTGVKFEVEGPEDLARVRDLYDGMVFHSDEIFGKLIQRIERMGLLARSAVVVTADHGEEFLDHGGLQHGKLYEEAVRIPLLIYHPRVAVGNRTDVAYSNVDLLPTLLDMVGHTSDGHYDGHDLLALDRLPDRWFGVSMTGSERSLAARRGDRKLILTCVPERRSEVYDLAADRTERHDLAATHELAARALERQLAEVLLGDPCQVMQDAVQGKSQTVGLDEESIRALEALGYL
jgi:arylsulfatase A-like enzyme